MKSFICASVLLAALASAPALAAPGANAVPSAASQESQGLPMQLAEAGYPRQLLLDAMLIGYDQGAREDANKPDNAAIEKAFPGYLEQLRVRGRREMASLMNERIGIIHRRVADIYASDLTEEQMQTVLAFLKTPTGAKLLSSMALAPVSDDRAADDLHFTAKEVATADRAASLHAFKQLSGPERVELLKFAATPAGQANRRVSVKAGSIVAEVMNKLMEDFAARIEPIATELLASYPKSAK